MSVDLKNKSMFKRKCGCSIDKHNLKRTSSPMDYKFNVLTTPVKSASDKKEYKLLISYWLK